MIYPSYNYKTITRPFCGIETVVFQLNVVHGIRTVTSPKSKVQSPGREGRDSYELRPESSSGSSYGLGRVRAQRLWSAA